MNTGQMIKIILLEKGLKQKWLASKLGTTKSNLSQMLSNNDMKFSYVIKICEVLNLTVDEFLKYSEQKKDTDHSAKTESVSQSNNTI